MQDLRQRLLHSARAVSASVTRGPACWHVTCGVLGVTNDAYPLHHRSEVDVAADAATLFAHLDDHRRLAAHMEKPSPMMLGATMRVETDAREGRAVGSHIRVVGHVLGANLSVEETVIEREPPLRKTWETIGEPQLLVVGAYRMGFEITPRGDRSHLVVLIDYRRPLRGLARWLGMLFGGAYARWCTRRMARDAESAFGSAAPT